MPPAPLSCGFWQSLVNLGLWAHHAKLCHRGHMAPSHWPLAPLQSIMTSPWLITSAKSQRGGLLKRQGLWPRKGWCWPTQSWGLCRRPSSLPPWAGEPPLQFAVGVPAAQTPAVVAGEGGAVHGEGLAGGCRELAGR